MANAVYGEGCSKAKKFDRSRRPFCSFPPDGWLFLRGRGVQADWQMEETADLHAELFEPVRGRRARRRRETGEIWQLDLLHGDHWEVYKTLKDFELGNRDRSVWCDGHPKDTFR